MAKKSLNGNVECRGYGRITLRRISERMGDGWSGYKLCPMTDFDVSGDESLGSATKVC